MAAQFYFEGFGLSEQMNVIDEAANELANSFYITIYQERCQTENTVATKCLTFGRLLVN